MKRTPPTICENLFYHGVADTVGLKGIWKLECFAKTKNGKNIKCEEVVDMEIFIEFYNEKISSKVFNEIGWNYQVTNSNHLEIKATTITLMMVHDPIEGKYVDALNATKCFVISNNILQIYFEHSDEKNSNILNFKRQ